VTTEKQSTPITAEGLRGLGFNDTQWQYVWWMDLPGNIRVRVENFTRGCAVEVDLRRIGTAPDLETVGRLIEVLKRMNGGG